MSIYIIAEVGINHNGDIRLAMDLVKMAADCGCDAVKFQKRTVDVVYSKEELDKLRPSFWGTTNRDQKYGLELSEKDYNILWAYSKSLHLDFFASAWDSESLKLIEKWDPPYHKVASALATNWDFCKEVALLARPTLISTGMCTREDVDNVVNVFEESQCEIILLHCVSLYPCEPHLCNLNAIKTLKETFGCRVGYSGHETGIGISLAAVAMGATVIERHITLDRSMYGSDQSASLEREGLRRLVAGIREIEAAMGDGKIEMAPGEEEVASKLRYWRDNG